MSKIFKPATPIEMMKFARHFYLQWHKDPMLVIHAEPKGKPHVLANAIVNSYMDGMGDAPFAVLDVTDFGDLTPAEMSMRVMQFVQSSPSDTIHFAIVDSSIRLELYLQLRDLGVRTVVIVYECRPSTHKTLHPNTFYFYNSAVSDEHQEYVFNGVNHTGEPINLLVKRIAE